MYEGKQENKEEKQKKRHAQKFILDNNISFFFSFQYYCDDGG